MERDEIIWQNEVLEMARQAGAAKFYPEAQSVKEENYLVGQKFLEAFAKLVEARTEERTAAKERADEREACAKVCDEASVPHLDEIHTDAQWSALYLAAAIRARDQI